MLAAEWRAESCAQRGRAVVGRKGENPRRRPARCACDPHRRLRGGALRLANCVMLARTSHSGAMSPLTESKDAALGSPRMGTGKSRTLIGSQTAVACEAAALRGGGTGMPQRPGMPAADQRGTFVPGGKMCRRVTRLLLVAVGTNRFYMMATYSKSERDDLSTEHRRRILAARESIKKSGS
jgi:hypothetical protein